MVTQRKRLSGAIGYAKLAIKKFEHLAQTTDNAQKRVWALEQLNAYNKRLDELQTQINQTPKGV